jgi:hypothetical protein
MKVLASLIMILGFTASLHSANASAVKNKEVSTGFNNVYVPGGFGPDTDAYVVGSGIYPNSCYKWSRADISSPTPMFHEIRTYANVDQDVMCLMVLVPYSQEIGLGRLASGSHTLRFLSSDGTYFDRTLTVE